MSQAGIFSVGGGGTALQTLTGNGGGAVSPTGNNINVVGDATNLLVIGNPGTSTLTVAPVAGAFVKTLSDDIGTTASPTAAGDIQIVGGTNVSTQTVGNTIVITAGHTILPTYTDVTTTPYVVTGTDYFLSVDVSLSPITVQLPDAPTARSVYIIKDRTGGAAVRNITVTTVTGVVLIDGATTFVMNTSYESINVLFNGTSYEVF